MTDLDALAASIWRRLSEDEAASLNRLAAQIGRAELAARLGALAHRVVRGDVDPPTAGVWLARQRPRGSGNA